MTKDHLTFGLVSVARAPLRGRDAEMAVLDEALDFVEAEGKARVVTLIGPQGIGKSRLMQDFVIKHRGGSSLLPRVYRGSARDTDAAFGLFARLLKMRFGLVDGMEREAAKTAVHLLRAHCDAILVGIGTVLADDPLLTCRLPGMETRSPHRVVLDSALRICPDSRLVHSARQIPLWLMVSETAEAASAARLGAAGAQVIRLAPVVGRCLAAAPADSLPALSWG